MRTVIVVVIFSLLCSASLGYCGDEIGVYFDNEGTINCLPNLAEFPSQVDAYIILHSCTSTTGVGGWEGAVSLPAEIVIATIDFGNGAINVGLHPEFMVGYAAPLPSTSVVVLAHLGLVVLGPGSIYLHSIGSPSIEGALGPIYVSGGEDGTLRELNYRFGSPVDPAATIGLSDCPMDSLSQGEVAIPDAPYEIVPLEERNGSVTIHTSLVPSPLKSMSDSDLISLREDTDLAVVGTVTDIAYDCFYDSFGHQAGFMRIRLAVDETLWGPSQAIVDIWIDGVEVPGCVQYAPSKAFGEVSRVVVGANLFAVAEFVNSAFWTRSAWLDFDRAASYKSGSESDRIGRLRLGAMLPYLIEDADLAAVFGVYQHNPDVWSIRVIAAIRGNPIALSESVVPVDAATQDFMVRLSDNGRWPVFCLLRESGNGFRVISPRSCSFSCRDDGLYGPSGLPYLELGVRK